LTLKIKIDYDNVIIHTTKMQLYSLILIQLLFVFNVVAAKEISQSHNKTEQIQAYQNSLEGVKLFIQDISNQTIHIIQSSNNSAKTTTQLTKLFIKVVDIQWMAKFALGKSWKTLSMQDQQNYLQAYQRYLINVYVPKFNEYNNQNIVINNVKLLSQDLYLVTMEINDKQKKYNLSYRCKYQNNSFKINDIIGVNFMSMLNTQRGEFNEIMKQGNITTLINILSNK